MALWPWRPPRCASSRRECTRNDFVAGCLGTRTKWCIGSSPLLSGGTSKHRKDRLKRVEDTQLRLSRLNGRVSCQKSLNEGSRTQPRHHPWRTRRLKVAYPREKSPSVSLLQGHKRAVWPPMWMYGLLDEAQGRTGVR